MSADLVVVDHGKCAEVASVLRDRGVPAAAEEKSVPLGIESERLPDFYFFAVAICHQTSPVGQPRLGGLLRAGDVAWGWDYLRRRLAERASQDLSLLDPQYWRRLRGDALLHLLESEDGPAHLTDPEGRAALIRDAGDLMALNGWDGAAAIYAEEDGWLRREHRGVLIRLAEFRAYRDPVRKKSFYLLELLRNECRWAYRDPEHLGAPVDYHEVRGHLRLGTIRIVESRLAQKLQTRLAVDQREDVAIRSAVAHAIDEIARTVGFTDSPTLHYLFWNVFRSCCGRESAHCYSCGPNCSLPERYRSDRSECLLASGCASRGAPTLVEHQHETDYY